MKRHTTGSLLAFLFVVALQRVSAQDSLRVAIAAVFGVATADTATWECCELRTPPSLMTLEKEGSTLHPTYGVDGRLYWNDRTSTFVQFEMSNERTWQFTYPPPAVRPFPFDSYEAERHLSSRHHELTAGQTLELLTTGRVRPWLFGAFGLRRITQHQRSFSTGFTDPTRRFETETDWHRLQRSILIGGGVRVHLSPRAFLGAELSRGWGISQQCTDCNQFVRTNDLDRPRTVIVHGIAGVTF